MQFREVFQYVSKSIISLFFFFRKLLELLRGGKSDRIEDKCLWDSRIEVNDELSNKMIVRVDKANLIVDLSAL